MHFIMLAVGADFHEGMLAHQQKKDNLEGHWNWYEIGGRYRGRLKIRAGREGIYGAPNPPPWEQQAREFMLSLNPTLRDPRNLCPLPRKGRADQARKADIDLEKLRYDKELEQWLLEAWAWLILPLEERPLPDLIATFGSLDALMPRDMLLEKYGTAEDFAGIKSRFWTRAVLTENNGWHDLDWTRSIGVGTRNWALNFWDRFVVPVEDNALLTILDCQM